MFNGKQSVVFNKNKALFRKINSTGSRSMYRYTTTTEFHYTGGKSGVKSDECPQVNTWVLWKVKNILFHTTIPFS